MKAKNIEEKEIEIVSIEKLVNEIVKKTNMKMNELRDQISEMGKKHYEEKIKDNREKKTLILLYEETSRKNKMLMQEYDKIVESKRKDEADIQRLDLENLLHTKQIADLEGIYRKNTEIIKELKSRYKTTCEKVSSLNEKREFRIKSKKEINEKIRRYLGIDIFPVEKDKVKIVFFNLPKDCYAILDFSSGQLIGECNPNINVEKLNYVFQKENSFRKFIKILRKEFIENI